MLKAEKHARNVLINVVLYTYICIYIYLIYVYILSSGLVYCGICVYMVITAQKPSCTLRAYDLHTDTCSFVGCILGFGLDGSS